MGLLAYILGRGTADEAAHRVALARVLRTLGGHAFDLPDAPAREFAAEAEAIARTVEDDRDGDLERGASVPTTIARFVERRRKAEAEYVRTTIPSLRDALFEVVRGVSEGLGEEENDDLEVTRALDALSEALADVGHPEALRLRAEAAISAVKDSLYKRQRRNQANVERMGRQLKALKARVLEAEARQAEDKLTGLPNRAALDQRLEQEVMVAQLTGDPLAVLMLDVDHFKRFNDTYGHAAGDHVLTALGEVLVRSFPRKTDFAARYGGEEFSVLLSNVPLERAERLAERFLEAVRELVLVHGGLELRVTCSVGIAALEPRESAATILARADAALYAAKRAGRDRLVSARSAPAS